MKNKKVSTIKSTFISQPLLNEKLFSKLTNSNRNKNSNLLNKNKIITDSNWNINISRAYSILSDESKRKRYDKYGIVDEDNFNFEDFMNNFTFNFNDFFVYLYGRYFRNFSCHHLKYFIIRKGKDIKSHIHEEKEKEIHYQNNLPYLIFNKGKGYKNFFKIINDEEEEKNNFNNDESEGEEIEEVVINLQNFLNLLIKI